MEPVTDNFSSLIRTVTASPAVHALWLNTLSMMENTGARKISRFEHPAYTNIIVLKHAAEEARHAYYLKKQIEKLDTTPLPDYSFEYMLAPVESYHYLHALDVAACRYLKEDLKMPQQDIKHGAYLLVTYAIEVRADQLYGVYQDELTAIHSKVNVKSIIKEEEGHLAEMTKMLKAFSTDWEIMAKIICAIEAVLFQNWVNALTAHFSKN